MHVQLNGGFAIGINAYLCLVNNALQTSVSTIENFHGNLVRTFRLHTQSQCMANKDGCRALLLHRVDGLA